MTKTYWLIFNHFGPPAITESQPASKYWESKGCVVEKYERTIKEEIPNAHDTRSPRNLYQG